MLDTLALHELYLLSLKHRVDSKLCPASLCSKTVPELFTLSSFEFCLSLLFRILPIYPMSNLYIYRFILLPCLCPFFSLLCIKSGSHIPGSALPPPQLHPQLLLAFFMSLKSNNNLIVTDKVENNTRDFLVKERRTMYFKVQLSIRRN